MRFPCTVCPLFGLHCVSRGDAHGSGQDSGCGWLANSRFPQGPAEVSGLCQFLPAFYSQFQPASCPFDSLNLHQDSVQVVQRSGSCVYQTERLLCFSSHTHRPWSFPAVCGGGWRVRGGVWCHPIPAFFLGRQGAPVLVFFSPFVSRWTQLWYW